MIAPKPSPASKLDPVVFIVDDDISVRESLEALVSFAGWRPETFASAEEFLSRAPADCPSCLILDVSLPELNGLDLQQLLASDRSEMPIIFVTGHGDIPMSVNAMKAGAVEFLTKPINDDALLKAIEHAVERSKASLHDQADIEQLRQKYRSLTPREQEVMGLVVSGLLNKQAASVLDISEITVKAHRGKMMQKMEANSLADLVRMAVRLDVVPMQNPWQAVRSEE